MGYALDALRPLLPLQASTLASLDDEVIQDWDQFVLRFTKLQDAMGVRLFPAVLEYLEEPFEDRPMLDKILQRLEKLGYLPNVFVANLSCYTQQLCPRLPRRRYPEGGLFKSGCGCCACVATVVGFGCTAGRDSEKADQR